MSTLQERLRKEAVRGVGDDGSECCYAPKWTCCDPAVLRETADRIDQLEAIGRRILAEKFDRFGPRKLGIEADDGEKCWIVHSDLIAALEAALAGAEPEASA
jgi:hypothetical protein